MFHIQITYSFQKEETDTIAADMDNEPFVLKNGEVLYRPGGPGTLMEKLKKTSFLSKILIMFAIVVGSRRLWNPKRFSVNWNGREATNQSIYYGLNGRRF